MTTVQLIHEAFTQAKTDVREGAGRLKQRRDAIDMRMTGFLGSGWTGVACESFVEAWEDWKLGADDVLEGLVGMGQLLEAVHQDFTQQDTESQQRLDQISARIIERLG